MNKSLITGMLSAFFFSFTFILNREMGLDGGHWLWSSSLRFYFMFILLALYLMITGQIKHTLTVISHNKISWLIWSHVGFGIFYTMLTYASTYTESWLVASTWQITILAGALLTPFTRQTNKNINHGKKNWLQRLPLLPLAFSTIILVGVIIVNHQPGQSITLIQILKSVLPITLAAFAYPLGNRKTMAIAGNQLTSMQRVFAMTLYSMPIWIVLSVYGFFNEIYPSVQQISQSFSVALFSGVIATALLFHACQSERDKPVNLAVIESTQSLEIVFTIILGVLVFHQNAPGSSGIIGLMIIVIGMLLNSFAPVLDQKLTQRD